MEADVKGTMKPGPVSAANPAAGMLQRVYTDTSDMDWNLTADIMGSVVKATPTDDTASYYKLSKGYVAASGPDFDQAAEAVDSWVDQWAQGLNPRPQIVTTATAKKGGGGVLALVLLAFLVLTDRKGRRR